MKQTDYSVPMWFPNQKYQGRKHGGKFRFRQKKFWPRNRYRDLILVSVADTETRFWSYTSLFTIFISVLHCQYVCLNFLNENGTKLRLGKNNATMEYGTLMTKGHSKQAPYFPFIKSPGVLLTKTCSCSWLYSIYKLKKCRDPKRPIHRPSKFSSGHVYAQRLSDDFWGLNLVYVAEGLQSVVLGRKKDPKDCIQFWMQTFFLLLLAAAFFCLNLSVLQIAACFAS